MNRYGRLLLVTFFISVCATFVAAQKDTTATSKKKSFSHGFDIETAYIKDKDETKVELKRMTIRGAKRTSEHVFNVTAYFIYPGKTPAKPESVVLGFVSASHDRERKFQDFRELFAQVDGKPVSFGTPELIESRLMGSYYKEVLGMFMPYDTFLNLVTNNNKDTLEMSLGNVRFQLEKNHLEALRDLASRIEK